MDMLVDIGLRNAMLAVPLALLALLLGLTVRRPALLHLLWVLVLLRLVVPPLWNVAVPRTVSEAPPNATSVALPARESVLANVVMLGQPPVAEIESGQEIEDAPWWKPELFPAGQTEPTTAEVKESASADSEAPAVLPRFERWRRGVGIVWLIGSLALSFVTLWRLGQFLLALRAVASTPGTIQAQADAIARRLGLARSPRVLLVHARVSPMLWGLVGAPRLILPAELWRRLDRAQRDALLAHELAHYRRADHWVRGLELVASVLFWWDPLLWVARRQLRDAEEQCCDAWVVWALPEQRRDYATAIVDAVGFLSEGRLGLPALASGVGQVRHLRRRLTMIMRGNTPRRLPRLALAALLGGGLAFTTLGPTWGQDRPRETPPPPERGDDERRPDERPVPRDRRSNDADREREAVQMELERARADFESARKRLEELDRRMGRLSRGSDRRDSERPAGGDRRPAPVGIAPRAEPPDISARLTGRSGDAPYAAGGGFAPAAMERRMQAMEKQLQEVMRSLEEIRRSERRGAPNGNTDRPGRGPADGSRGLPRRPVLPSPGGGGPGDPAGGLPLAPELPPPIGPVTAPAAPSAPALPLPPRPPVDDDQRR